MSGTPYFVPSYLDYSSPDNWRRLAMSMPHVGPLRFAPAGSTYTVSKADLDWVIKFSSTGDLYVPLDAELENERIPIGAQIAVMNASYGRVRINPAEGVTIVSGESTRFVVNKWKVGILVKTGANFWLLSLGQGTGGGTNTVPLAPVLKDCFGLSGGIYVGWVKPTDDGGSAITQYIVERSENGTDWLASGFTQPDTPYLTVGDLTAGKTYAFRVKAINQVGASEPSNVLSATPSSEFNNASGGTISQYEKDGRKFKVHRFDGDGQLFVTKAVSPFRVLVVGKGGDAPGPNYPRADGAGGGGGVVEKFVTFTEGTISVTVNSSGSSIGSYASASAGDRGNSGSGYSSGSGGASGEPTRNAGSGGGEQGFGGAGGGAGGPGVFAQGGGGPGIKSDITGTLVEYGRGGDPAWRGITPTRPEPGSGAGGVDNSNAGQGGVGGVVIVSYEVSPYNDASGGEVIDYSDQQGNRWRAHRFTSSGTFTVNAASNQFRAMVLGGGAGGGYGTGGGHGFFNDTMVDLAVQSYTITVGAAVDGGYHEVTNRDAPGNNGQRSAIEGVLSSPGGISRGDVVGPGPTTNITGTVVQYGGSGGRCVINEDRNEGGYPGGGTGGSTATGASWPGGGGGGGQWNSGSGARGEVVIAYRIKNPD